MPYTKIQPEPRVCPVCGKTFEVGGRGRPPKRQVYCSHACHMAVREPVHTGSHAPRPKKGRDTIHVEAWLRARYLDDRMTMAQIGRLAGCSSQSVHRHMREFGIPRRSTAESMPRTRRSRGPARGGLSLSDYQMLHDAQNGLCAACGQPESKAHRNGAILRLAVDHDHDTGRVRALLCSRCNYSLGFARDDPAVLRQLIDYLERHRIT